MARPFRDLAILVTILPLAWCSGAVAASMMEAPQRISPDQPGIGQTLPTPDPPGRATEEAPPVASTHGDWQMRCDKPAGSTNELCVLMQNVVAEDRDNVGLTVVIIRTADRQSHVMRIIAPIDIFLPSGLGLRVDETGLGSAPFIRCTPTGCVAEVMLSDELVNLFRSGKTATFIISLKPEEGIGIPISLAGFGAGFHALP